MALVKQEENDIESGDAWMAYWANPETEAATVKLEEEKPSMANLESDYEESGDESVINDVVKKESGNTINVAKTVGKASKMNHNRYVKREKGKNVKDNLAFESFEKRLMNAPVSSAVANMCVYQCTKCQTKMIARDSIYQHFRRFHAGFEKGKYNDYLIKIVAHQCSICSMKILCDKKVILSHISTAHKISSLKNYCERENLLNMIKVPNFQIKHNQFDRKDLQGHKISKNLGNYCKF